MYHVKRSLQRGSVPISFTVAVETGESGCVRETKNTVCIATVINEVITIQTDIRKNINLNGRKRGPEKT